MDINAVGGLAKWDTTGPQAKPDGKITDSELLSVVFNPEKRPEFLKDIADEAIAADERGQQARATNLKLLYFSIANISDIRGTLNTYDKAQIAAILKDPETRHFLSEKFSLEKTRRKAIKTTFPRHKMGKTETIVSQIELKRQQAESLRKSWEGISIE
ncbi:MAG: hypothetical protein LBQ83_00075 [Candidatus Margulisbacteria bacterium]|jgi:hypothetical protein|nr:hypothetical protein [Candidatus Margulisiibacteriota bacterium]